MPKFMTLVYILPVLTKAQIKSNTYDNKILTFNIQFYNTNNDYFGTSINNTTCLNDYYYLSVNFTCPCVSTKYKCPYYFFKSNEFKNIKYNNIKLIDTCRTDYSQNNTNKCIDCDLYSIKYNYTINGSCNISYIIIMSTYICLFLAIIITLIIVGIFIKRYNYKQISLSKYKEYEDL
jgi:hypothetical protein